MDCYVGGTRFVALHVSPVAFLLAVALIVAVNAAFAYVIVRLWNVLRRQPSAAH